MRVVHVIDRLGIGGAEVLVVAAARQAVRHGLEVAVVSLDAPRESPVLQALRALDVHVHHVPSQSGRSLLDVGRFRRLRSEVMGLRPDVVHTHLAYADTLGPLAVAGAGVGVVSTLHNERGGVRTGQFVRDRLEAAVLQRRADVLLAVGPSVARSQAARLARPDVRVLLNPVRPQEPVTGSARDAVRAELLHARPGPLLLAVGRLTEQKGYTDLLQAFARLRRSMPGCVLAIAGQGHLKGALEETRAALGLDASVLLLGPRDDVPALLAATDVVVLSSLWEGLPLIVLEAMAAGRVVVATDVGDVAYALAGTGVLTPPRDVPALAAALGEVLRQPQRRQELGGGARRVVLERHDESRWGDEVVEAYRTACRKHDRVSVAILTHGYYPRVGGIERQRALVTPRLMDHGVDPVVLTRRVPGRPVRDMVDDVRVVRIPTFLDAPGGSRVARRVLRPLSSASYTFNCLLLLATSRPDVVAAHELISTTRTALIARRLLRIPVVVMSHRSGTIGDVGRHAGSARGQRLLRAVRDQADLVLSVSAEADAELAGLGVPAPRRAVVANGVDTRRLRPAGPAERQELRKELGIPDQVRVAVYTGRLAVEKRVGLLVRAWPDVRRRVPGAVLLVVGTGPLEEDLRTEAGEGVRFTGPVLDVGPWLRAADVFVLPSTAEGLSNALLEAQSCGLPAVVTDVGAAREVLASGGGAVVDVDDVDGLLEALMTLLEDLELASRRGALARSFAVQDWSVDRTVAALADAYRSLGRPGQPGGRRC